jgi:hypothetical protein
MKRHILDEHVSASHAMEIRKKVPSIAQIGVDWGETGWDDIEQIIPHLHHSKATFHTLDEDFFKRRFLHKDYCIVFYNVSLNDFVECFLNLLHHPLFDTHAKRIGKIIKVSLNNIVYCDVSDRQIRKVAW